MPDQTPIKNSIANYLFLTTHSLTFNPIREIHAPLTSDVTFPCVLFWYFVKKCKPKSTMIYSWLINTDYSCFANIGQFHPNSLSLICKKLVLTHSKRFFPLFKLRLAASPFQHIFFKQLHIIMRSRSWTTSLGSYLEPVMIWLDLLPASFQLTGMSSSRMTLSSSFLSRQYFISAISHMTMNSSSHSPISENTSENKSLPKLCLVIIFFSSVYYLESL